MQEAIKELFGVSFLQVLGKLWETAHKLKIRLDGVPIKYDNYVAHKCVLMQHW